MYDDNVNVFSIYVMQQPHQANFTHSEKENRLNCSGWLNLKKNENTIAKRKQWRKQKKMFIIFLESKYLLHDNFVFILHFAYMTMKMSERMILHNKLCWSRRMNIFVFNMFMYVVLKLSIFIYTWIILMLYYFLYCLLLFYLNILYNFYVWVKWFRMWSHPFELKNT